MALQVFQKVVSVKRLKDLLICGDETFGKKNPLDSLYKLQVLLQTAHNEPDKVHWLLLMMFDLLLNKDMLPGNLTMEALSGKKGGKGFLGLVHCIFSQLLRSVFKTWQSKAGACVALQAVREGEAAQPHGVQRPLQR